ncbi:MAG: hypothetical protein FD169_417 [Bacillota bacterium]|nr:MAG: hypothetical protein FD169_417 [Bacillota bacterium]MBS3950662.1 shikimate kinase [Peptococcaceae bacterium]
MHLILTGMMGSGKSSVGRRLGAALTARFLDLDEMIVDSFTMSITDVFKKLGEEAFRQREEELMLSLAATEESIVLALGGGSVLSERGMNALKKVGRVVYLRARVSSLARRLIRSKHNLPLVAEESDLEARLTSILKVRQDLYTGYADFSVDADDMTPNQVAAHIAAWWKEGQQSEL